MMGMLTTMFMAATFGEKELGLNERVLIPTILGIQLVGMFGAWFFARLSEKIGNLKALVISVIVWILICVYAFTIKGASGFIIAAVFIGVVMGGSQQQRLALAHIDHGAPGRTRRRGGQARRVVGECVASILRRARQVSHG